MLNDVELIDLVQPNAHTLRLQACGMALLGNLLDTAQTANRSCAWLYHTFV
jgi:hypothetical protein